MAVTLEQQRTDECIKNLFALVEKNEALSSLELENAKKTIIENVTSLAKANMFKNGCPKNLSLEIHNYDSSIVEESSLIQTLGKGVLLGAAGGLGFF